MIPRMTLFDSTQELISFKDQNNSKINLTSEKDPILCNHCKRTASNGVRCLGMCVADNDYWNNSNLHIKIWWKLLFNPFNFLYDRYKVLFINNKEKIIFLYINK